MRRSGSRMDEGDKAVRNAVGLARIAGRAAEELRQVLDSAIPPDAPDVKVEIGDQLIIVPRQALENLVQDLWSLSWGQTSTPVPATTEIGTQQAADLLHVSRPYFVKLLDDGALPFRKVGNRRRVRVADVMAYKWRDDQSRWGALVDVVADADQLESSTS